VQSLDVLRAAKECGVYTKSSIMLGLGETDDEVIDTMLDLKHAGARPLLLPFCSCCGNAVGNIFGFPRLRPVFFENFSPVWYLSVMLANFQMIGLGRLFSRALLLLLVLPWQRRDGFVALDLPFIQVWTS
jgi:hypothetical protein